MQQKRDDSTGTILTGFQCRSCIHLSRVPHPQIGVKKTCDKLGTLPSAAAPKACYQVDPLQVIEVDHRMYRALQRYMAKSTAATRQVLAYTILNTEVLQKQRLSIGLPVYFCIAGDYLQNYFSGVVVGASADGEFVYVSSALESGVGNSLITLLRASVLTEDQWVKKRHQLVKQARIEEPRSRSSKPTLFEELQMPKAEWRAYRQSLMAKPEEYVPPSLDSVPQHWIDKRKALSLKEEAVKGVKYAASKSRQERARKKGKPGAPGKQATTKQSQKLSNDGRILIHRA